jgi:hypothetical protein
MPSNEAEIRDLAYFLWEQDGRPPGRDHEYWQRALAATSERAEPDIPVVPASEGPGPRKPGTLTASRTMVAARPKSPPRFRSEASRARIAGAVAKKR